VRFQSGLNLPLSDIDVRHEPFLSVALAHGHRVPVLRLLTPIATAPLGAQFEMLEARKAIRD